MDSPRLLLPFSFNISHNISNKANIDCIPHQHRNQDTDTTDLRPTSPNRRIHPASHSTMYLGKFLPGLAASSALDSPISRRGEPQCLKDCVRKTIEPFVVVGAEEGFRQALGAHNTRETCTSSADCMDTVQIFIEEITQMVFRDRLDDKNGNFANSLKDGYTGSQCDTRCLVKTAQTAAAQAGALAMAVGQKHFYGNDAFWNRWSPQQMIELDRAIRQLKGRNLAEKAYVLEENQLNKTESHLEVARTASVRKFDLTAFRYNGTAEIPLLHHPTISRVMARKILSYFPGWGPDPDDVTHDPEHGDLGLHVPSKDYFLVTDMTRFDDFGKFDKDLHENMTHAYTTISRESEYSGPAGFAHFLYHTRLYPNATEQKSTPLAHEPWDRVLDGIHTPIRLSPPRSEAEEDQWQLGAWIWQHHAYDVANTSHPVPNLLREEHSVNPGYFGYGENQVQDHGPHMIQWVTDSQAEPLKGVNEAGYTHQPWTNPWFFEYASNYSSFPYGYRAGIQYDGSPVHFKGTRDDMALAIRGYTFEFMMYKLAFRKESGDYFKEHAFDQTTGAVVDFDMLSPEPYDEKWPYVTAVTGDGRAFRRSLSANPTVVGGKRIYDILTWPMGKPIFDERGEPIKLVYDTKTGLAETRYGRALVPLDKNMGGL
jgi:hypothetical protein